jgi:hypothetical protein
VDQVPRLRRTGRCVVTPDRIEALVAYCGERIAQCRRDEHKFGAFSSITYEAVTERRALADVLTQLGYPVPPVDHADLHGRDSGRRARDAAGERRPRQYRRHAEGGV